jgi:hypothetical protein
MTDAPKPPSAIALLDRVLTWIALLFGGGTLVSDRLLGLECLGHAQGLERPHHWSRRSVVLSLVVIVARSIPLSARKGTHI